MRSRTRIETPVPIATCLGTSPSSCPGWNRSRSGPCRIFGSTSLPPVTKSMNCSPKCGWPSKGNHRSSPFISPQWPRKWRSSRKGPPTKRKSGTSKKSRRMGLRSRCSCQKVVGFPSNSIFKTRNTKICQWSPTSPRAPAWCTTTMRLTSSSSTLENTCSSTWNSLWNFTKAESSLQATHDFTIFIFIFTIPFLYFTPLVPWYSHYLNSSFV